MNEWIRRILGASSLIGCGAGLAVVWLTVQQGMPNFLTGMLVCLFSLLYGYGAVTGVMLLQKHPHGVTANFFYWATQTVQYTTVVASYLFWTPAAVLMWWNGSRGKLEFAAQLGTTFRFTMAEIGTEARIGLNVLAIAACVYLFRQSRREAAQSGARASTDVEAGELTGAEA